MLTLTTGRELATLTIGLRRLIGKTALAIATILTHGLLETTSTTLWAGLTLLTLEITARTLVTHTVVG
jgi:hypothetical protein